MEQLADRLDLEAAAFVQVLVNEYAPGAGIGWHRDGPVYGEILGLSLLAPCVMRLRRRDGSGSGSGSGFVRRHMLVAGGSAYRLLGEACSLGAFDHADDGLALLLTFLTLAA